MATRRLECPICHNKSSIYLKKGQTVHRCKECTRLVRAIGAPRRTRKKKVDEQSERV